MEKSNDFLGTEKVGKLLLKFSVPCVLSLLISALYNIVDQIFVGNSQLGYLGNAATGIVFPLLIVVQAFAWLISDGCAAFLSICQGKKDTENAHKCIGSGITISIIVSIVLMIIALVFKEPILRLFGASDQTIGMASEYLTIVACFFPAFMFLNALNAVIRSDGSPAYSMIAMASGAIVNIILDPIFIFGFNWGIGGAAWATVIGQLVSCIFTIVYLFKAKTFRLRLKSFIPDFKVFKNALGLGISSFITQISIVLISLTCNIMMATYGGLSKYGCDIPISVISVETKVFTVLINIVVGIVLGGQPIFGYNMGAKKYKRVKESFKKIIIATLCVCLVFTLINEIYPDLFILPFGNGGKDTVLYMEFARKTFRIFLSLVTFTCLIKVTSIFFQSTGKPIKATICSLTRDIICFIPLVICLPLIFESKGEGQGITALLFAAPIADFIGIIVALTLTIIMFKSLGKEIALDEDEQNIKDDYTQISNSYEGLIITINRTHGSLGKAIGEKLAAKLNVPFYCKELIVLTAQESGLDAKYISQNDILSMSVENNVYVSKNVSQITIEAQKQVLEEIAKKGSCVIVGRASNYFLKENDKLLSMFLYCDDDLRVENIMKMYGDSETEARKNMKKSDDSRRKYYELISNYKWDDLKQYDLCINTKIGVDKATDLIYEFVKDNY